MRYSHKQRHLKNKEYKKLKDSQAKKNYLSANYNGGNRNGDQSDQALGQFSKKDSHLNKKG